MSSELEFKFRVPAARLGSLAKAMKRAGGRAERLQAVYFDTADERLAKHGVTLRLRREGRRWIQTVKVGTADPLGRLEDNAVVAVQAAAAPVIDLTRHDGSAVAAALQRALGGGNVPPLLPRYRTDVMRTSRRVSSDGARVELALDVGAITAGERSLPVRELELELKSGPVGPWLALASRWAAAHRLSISTVSKAERGAWLVNGAGSADAVKAVPPEIDRKASPAAFFDACIEASLAQVLANGSRVADGTGGAEVVHQLRVGLRRLRTALRELASFGRAIDPAWEATLHRAFLELGADRDRTVVLPKIAAKIAACGAPALAPVGMAARVRRPETVVKDARLQRTLLTLIALCRKGAPAVGAGAATAGGARAALRKLLDRLLKKVERDSHRFADLEPALQHRVRKRLKRLRYLSEFAAPLFGDRRVGRYLERWEQAQDALGELTVDGVAANFYRARVDAEPEAWFAVGWLAARQAAATEQCGRALRRASKAPPFWRR